jgi:hypothetical protein
MSRGSSHPTAREVKRRLDDIEGEDSERQTLAEIVNNDDDPEEADTAEADSDPTLADVINDTEEADQ